MGSGSWTSDTWKSYRTAAKIDTSRSVEDIYNMGDVKPKYLPQNVMRESCDSEEHPESTPIAVFLDVTGSMGRIVHNCAKRLGDFVGEIYEKSIVTDPQILFGAVDDSFATDTPLQVTQYESDIRIAEQLTDLKFISRGAGNGFESYPLAWYFCARHTKIDSYEKHGRKGFLFTMGDDGYPNEMSVAEIKKVFGDKIPNRVTTQEILNEVSQKYEVFHLCFTQGGSYYEKDYRDWKKLMGSHAIKVTDWQYLPEIMNGVLAIYQGKTLKDIVAEKDEDCKECLTIALRGLKPTEIVEGSDLVTFA